MTNKIKVKEVLLTTKIVKVHKWITQQTRINQMLTFKTKSYKIIQKIKKLENQNKEI